MDITSAVEWRKPREEGFLVRLPSGKTCRLRPIAMDNMVISGLFPDFMAPIIQEAISGKHSELDITAIMEKVGIVDAIKQEQEMKRILCKSAFVYPRIVDEPKADDEIAFEDVEIGDAEFVIRLVQRPVNELATFSAKQAVDVESVEIVRDDEQKAV